MSTLAKSFYAMFVDDVKSQCVFDVYKRGGSVFTEKITNIINNIITRLGYCYENEYLRVDAIGWTLRTDLKADFDNCDMNCHLWDLEIAVEHENNKRDWIDELIKLAHIRCPLKILICYNACNARDKDWEKLSLAVKCLHSLKTFDVDSKEQYLIIIGNASAIGSAYTEFDYRGYICDNSSNIITELRKEL